MNVLSLFDGISCGHVALKKAGIHVDSYFASEIDPDAICVTQHNFPKTKQIGNVRRVYASDLPEIDLLIGGSPCQGFSTAGKHMNFDDPRSGLFWEFVRLLNRKHPKYFLLENVVMKKEWQDVISDALGVKPVMINSALTSAAVRRRLYWTNIPGIEQPKDLGITFGDIREYGHPKDSMYYSDKALAWFREYEADSGRKFRIIGDDEKMQTLEASMCKKYSKQRFFGIQDTHGLRYITPLECERCMNLPDGYTDCISNTARYRTLGNGWEVNAVAHIFRCMKPVL